ncbi:MAG: hypothetical protein Q7S57_04110 [bacterium]|nr:hypothetical protein [bacterium]
MKKKPKIKIGLHDVGGKIKTLLAEGTADGAFWIVGGEKAKMKKVETPHDIPAKQFMRDFEAVLRGEHLWETVDVRALSFCGPIVAQDPPVCLRLVNRHILEPITLEGVVALNDGMAAFYGSAVGGELKGHNGAAAFYTLGTGLGAGTREWVFNPTTSEEELRLADNEMHFQINTESSVRRLCNCGLDGCAEAEVNENALKDLLLAEKLDLTKLIKSGKTDSNIGRDVEYHRDLQLDSPYKTQIERVLAIWNDRVGTVVANVHGSRVMGGDSVRIAPMYVFGGGLQSLVDVKRVRNKVLGLSKGKPQNGVRFTIAREVVLGNRAGCIGAAAAAMMRYYGLTLEELRFLPSEPMKIAKKK